MYISDDIRYAGVNDHAVDLFEGQYTVPHGMSYNSYVILDDKIAVMDTVDAHFTHEWMDNLQICSATGSRIISSCSIWSRITPPISQTL